MWCIERERETSQKGNILDMSGMKMWEYGLSEWMSEQEVVVNERMKSIFQSTSVWITEWYENETEPAESISGCCVYHYK